MKKLLITGFIIVSLSLSGCSLTRTNAMTGEEETNSTTNGALFGCLGGAIAGALINRGKGAAIGCAAAGTVGAVVGSEMDKQEELLRKELRSSGVIVKRSGNNIKLILDGDITFTSGSAQVSSSMKPTFKSIVKVMNNFKKTNLIIIGHTDSQGSTQYNQNLSEVRAKSVQQNLNGYGLARNRTFTDGFGESSPLCSNSTTQGRACNRRVELVISPKS